jgi:tRNA A-37 threonylcarbamoyl transferase component Bud32
MYFVNWQREISIKELESGQKVIIKQNKLTKNFHEYLLISAYTLISILLAHPDAPPQVGKEIIKNEGFDMRRSLSKLGIDTPMLISISDDTLIEEYIEGGDLYKALLNGKDISLAFQAGILTGRLHRAGYVFTDNKAQNYLVVSDNLLYRTDLGFLQKKNSVFSRSIDIGSFLASVIDFETPRYTSIEKAFFAGYMSGSRKGIPYLSIVLRNILSLGFASDQYMMLQNMFVDSTK